MFEIACEVANTSGKTLTIETSIPEAEKPDVQILKSGQQMGVFASQTGSTVKITVVSVEAIDRIEKLEAALRKYADEEYNGYNADGAHARKALEGKDD